MALPLLPPQHKTLLYTSFQAHCMSLVLSFQPEVISSQNVHITYLPTWPTPADNYFWIFVYLSFSFSPGVWTAVSVQVLWEKKYEFSVKTCLTGKPRGLLLRQGQWTNSFLFCLLHCLRLCGKLGHRLLLLTRPGSITTDDWIALSSSSWKSPARGLWFPRLWRWDRVRSRKISNHSHTIEWKAVWCFSVESELQSVLFLFF